MKNGKLPTRQHKIIMGANGLSSDEWLVIRDLQTTIEIVSRTELKNIDKKKPKTKILSKNIQSR